MTYIKNKIRRMILIITQVWKFCLYCIIEDVKMIYFYYASDELRSLRMRIKFHRFLKKFLRRKPN